MTLIPEVLFDISIEDLFDDRQVWQEYNRAKVASVGQFLRSKARAFPSLNKAVSDAAKQFVQIWGVLAMVYDLDDCDPAGICVALYQYRKKAGLAAAVFGGDLRKNSSSPELLMAASLSEMAMFLGTAVPQLTGLSPDPSIDSFSPEVQNLLFSVARSIHPIKAWEIDVWTKFTPSRVFNARIHDQSFQGALNRRIHNVAINQAWATIGDFARVEPKRRFWIHHFGSKCIDALLMRAVELVATLPDSQTMDNFRNRSFLQLFEDELTGNAHLKESWVKVIRLRAGVDGGVVARYSWIGEQLDLSGSRVKQMELQAWNRIKVKEPWRSFAVGLIEGVLQNSLAWPTLENLEDEEPWFRGAAASPEVFRYIIEWIGKGEMSVIKVDSVYVCRRRPATAQEEPLEEEESTDRLP